MDTAKLAPLTRIALRYIAGALITKGLLDADSASLFTDPELIDLAHLGIGVVFATGTEFWYWLASKLGWKK